MLFDGSGNHFHNEIQHPAPQKSVKITHKCLRGYIHVKSTKKSIFQKCSHLILQLINYYSWKFHQEIRSGSGVMSISNSKIEMRIEQHWNLQSVFLETPSWFAGPTISQDWVNQIGWNFGWRLPKPCLCAWRSRIFEKLILKKDKNIFVFFHIKNLQFLIFVFFF